MTRADVDEGLIRHELGLPRNVFTPAQVEELRATIRPDWQRRADCVQVGWDVWFLDKDDRITAPMRALCVGCPVRRSCIASAILIGELGVWAGTNQSSRDKAAQQISKGADIAQVLAQVLRSGTRKPHTADTEAGVAA